MRPAPATALLAWACNHPVGLGLQRRHHLACSPIAAPPAARLAASLQLATADARRWYDEMHIPPARYMLRRLKSDVETLALLEETVKAATLGGGGCNRMCWRLQRYFGIGCNPMCWRLQAYIVCERQRAASSLPMVMGGSDERSSPLAGCVGGAH